MAYVIAEPCIGTKDAACVDACPVDCIHPKKDEPGYAEADQLFIDPVECIDCGACVPVCPVSAIYAAAVSYTHLDVYKRQVGKLLLRARTVVTRGSCAAWKACGPPQDWPMVATLAVSSLP